MKNAQHELERSIEINWNVQYQLTIKSVDCNSCKVLRAFPLPSRYRQH